MLLFLPTLPLLTAYFKLSPCQLPLSTVNSPPLTKIVQKLCGCGQQVNAEA